MRGIDVSQWQGNIRFFLVERAGIELVYIKSSEGMDLIDPFFRRNYEGAKEAGLPVGFYHYLTARSILAARWEAHHFVTVTEGLVCEGKMVLDLEDLSGLTDIQINEIALAFLEAVEAYSSKHAAIYVDASNAMRLNADVAAYALWIAQYDVKEPDMTGNPWENWAGWQYTDTGRVAGIQGYVDRSEFTVDILDENAGTVERMGEPSVSESGDARRQAERYILYQVKPGDTLWGIAMRFGTTVDALKQWNKIPNSNLIYTGQIIKIMRV